METLLAGGLVVLLMVLLALLVFGGIVGVIGLIVFQSIKRRGRWGINLQVADCPECGTPAPKVRKPANARQAMWGGWTCANCDTEMDKWGARIG